MEYLKEHQKEMYDILMKYYKIFELLLNIMNILENGNIKMDDLKIQNQVHI